jgi:hypothetical protein
MAPFRGSLGAKAPPACMLGTAPWRWPLDLVSRRTGDRCKLASDLGVVGRFKGRWGRAWFGAAVGRAPSSPRLPLMAPAAAQAMDGGHRRSSPCGAAFIVARCPLLRGVEKGGPGTGSAWGRAGSTDGQTDRKGPAVRPVPVWPRGVRRRGGLRDRLGTCVASRNEPREGARGLERRGRGGAARVRARGARRRGAARRRRPENNSQRHYSDVKISKNLNRSAQSGE